MSSSAAMDGARSSNAPSSPAVGTPARAASTLSASLGMPRRRQVLVEVGAGEDVDGSGHGVTLRTPAGRHPTGSHHRRPPRRCDAGIMPSPAEPSPWESTVVLGNGDVAVIRPLTPHDREALATFHRRQSKDSIYRRYFSPKPELSERDLDHFTDVDMIDRVALVVERRASSSPGRATSAGRVAPTPTPRSWSTTPSTARASPR